MNFKGHFVGGVVASATVASVSYLTLPDKTLNIASPSILFSVCLFMSLFPDLDTASIPQRWFYRSLMIIMPYIYIYHGPDLLFITSIFSILPLLHRHRGWTHWKKTPLIISLVILWIYDRNKGVYKIDRYDLIINYFMFTLSVMVGHYTHLLLDSRKIRIFNNKGDHH